MAKGDALAIMLGGKGPGPEGGGDLGPMPDVGDEMSAEDSAFEGAAIAAMESYDAGDTAGFALNLKDAIEICLQKHMSGEEGY